MACNSQGFWIPWWWLRLSDRNMLEWLNNNKLICAFCWFLQQFPPLRLDKKRSKGTAIPVRPGQALRVPGGWGYQISRQSAHEGGKVVSRKQPADFTLQEIFLELISVRDCVDPRAIVRPEGLCRWKITMTISGIEPVTCRFWAQCLNQLRQRACICIVTKYLLRILEIRWKV